MRRRPRWTLNQIPQLPPVKEPFPNPTDLDQADRASGLDPRWEWICLPELGGKESWIRGRCNHRDIIPIHDVSGVLVARLCLTCDQQWTIPVEVRWSR